MPGFSFDDLADAGPGSELVTSFRYPASNPIIYTKNAVNCWYFGSKTVAVSDKELADTLANQCTGTLWNKYLGWNGNPPNLTNRSISGNTYAGQPPGWGRSYADMLDAVEYAPKRKFEIPEEKAHTCRPCQLLTSVVCAVCGKDMPVF